MSAYPDEVFFLLATPTGHDAYWNPHLPAEEMRKHVDNSKLIYHPRPVNYMVTIQGSPLSPHYMFQEVHDPDLVMLLKRY